MTDEQHSPTRTERQRINPADGYELNYWTRQLRCTEQDLLIAIAAVGPEIKAVREHLAGQRQGPGGGSLVCA